MNILIITGSYFPNIDPRSLRWTALSEEFSKLGHIVHVVTSNITGQKRNEQHNGVFVHRVEGGWLEKIKNRVSTYNKANARVKTGFNGKIYPGHLTNIIRNYISGIIKLVWRAFYWPDGSFLFIWPAFWTSRRLLTHNKFDVLISVSHPFSSHVVGLMIHKVNPEVKWIVDNGDPFSFLNESMPNNFFLFKRLNFWIESKVISASKSFVVATIETATLYRKLFPNNNAKILVIPALLQKGVYQKNGNQPDSMNHRSIVLLFVGTFYKSIRRAEPLLEIFNNLIAVSCELADRLELHIVGSKDFIFNALVERPKLLNKVILHGMLPHRQAIESMCAADCLVNIGNSTSYQLPSKVIEYMATGKPILNVRTIENDSSSKILEDYPLLFDWNIQKINDISALANFIIANQGRSINPEDVKKMIFPYQLDSIKDRYLGLIH